MKILIFEGQVCIAEETVPIRIYKEDLHYFFEPAVYLQNIDDMDVYRVGSGAISHDLEDLLVKINTFKSRYSEIIKIEKNSNF